MYNDATQERIARLLELKRERAGTNADELAALRAQVAELAAEYDSRALALRDGYAANLAAFNRAAQQQQQTAAQQQQLMGQLADVRDMTVAAAFNTAANQFWPEKNLSPEKLSELQTSAIPEINRLYADPQFNAALIRGDTSAVAEVARVAVNSHPDNENYVKQLDSAVQLQQDASNPDLTPAQRMNADWELASSLAGMNMAKKGHPGGVKKPVVSPEALMYEIQNQRTSGDDTWNVDDAAEDLTRR